ncbi:MAG TPA: ATP-binding protein [Gemmataceae bacterium]|nr:ATP-binding protein [Gemmataceae bacterium]
MATLSTPALLPSPSSRWELAAEAIAVKIRWFGLLVGYLLVNCASDTQHQPLLNALLALGAAFTLADTWYSVRGRVFLARYPLSVSALEALFIGLLCYFHGGLESPFRYYYFLSLICCAIRHASQVTYATCALHCLSFGLLYLALPLEERHLPTLVLTLVVLGWVTWASNALALLLKRVGEYLGELNATLREHQTQLEDRIAERTRELQEAQAHVLHQEKMAAFGLLAAGIAHEVGNPLTSISSLVQVVQRHGCDEYTGEKLALVSGQLQRIQTTLRELVNFSRPASTTRTRVSLAEVLEEALSIAKYYKRTGDRVLRREVPADLPLLVGVRDQLVQVFLNLVLNALDATHRTGKEARVEVRAERKGDALSVTVSDNGSGIATEHVGRLFQPYFTTKKHGTGLGLFVTQKLVQEHGGTVAYEANRSGGAVFRVLLHVPEPVLA